MAKGIVLTIKRRDWRDEKQLNITQAGTPRSGKSHWF